MKCPDFWVLYKEPRHLTLQSAAKFKAHSELVEKTLTQNHESGTVEELRYWADELIPICTVD